MFLSNAEKMRAADRRAIEERKIPSTLLMTTAATHLADAAQEMLPAGKCVCIFCGSGNNGGDGVAAAYLLLKRDVDARAWLVGSRAKMPPAPREMERRLRELGGTLLDFDENTALPENCGVLVDAMFGIGLNKPLQGRALAAAELMNAAGSPIIAADIASGVIADTGEVPGGAVHADVTVTFSMAKPGHFVEPGCACSGEVRVRDIGIPQGLLINARLDAAVLQEGEFSLPKRDELTHKYSYGRLLILGGSVGYTGAVSLCARAAVRSGAGVVFAGVPEQVYEITAVKNDEAVIFPLTGDEKGRFSPNALPDALVRLETATAAVLGPGLGRSAELTAFVREIVQAARTPLVLDADALFAVGQDPDVLRAASAPLILTPHTGEFKTLGGTLTGDRLGDARSFAQKYNCTLILKGHHTIAAFPDGETVVCPYGNPGMAKGGSGDVLAGVLGAMLCQLPPKDAVKAALVIHARAGDLAAGQFGEYSMTASDMINCIYAITKQLSSR